jgi:3-oxoadipate enol-lactonase
MTRATYMTGLIGCVLLAVMLLGTVPAQGQSASKRTYTWANGKEMPYPEYIEDQGDFEMVLIHGLGANNEIWESISPYLMGTFKVWTFELAGHGTTQPTLDPSIDSESKRLAEFLKEEGIVYPTLVGHGMGGMIALQYAIDHPADVHRLIMMDSAPMQLASAEQKNLIGQAILEDYDRFVAGRYMNMSFEPDITEVVLEMALRTHSPTFVSLLMSSFDYDVTDELGRLSVPLLVIGSEMMFPSAESCRPLLKTIGFQKAKSLSFKRMGKTGHYMMMEQPVFLASVLLAFGVTAEYSFDVD